MPSQTPRNDYNIYIGLDDLYGYGLNQKTLSLKLFGQWVTNLVPPLKSNLFFMKNSKF